MAQLVYTRLAQGAGHALATPTTRTALLHKENAQPEQTRMQLVLEFRAPGFGPVHTPAGTIPRVEVDFSGVAAMAVNWAHAIGRLVVGKEKVPPWPGEARVATHNPSSHTTTIRWVKGAAGVGAVLDALGNWLNGARAAVGLGGATAAEEGAAADAATAEGLSLPALLALLALAAVTAYLIWQALTGWRFSRAVLETAKKAGGAVIHALGVPARDILIGGAVVVGLVALVRARGP